MMLLKRFVFRTKDFLRYGLNFAFGGGSCLVCGKETVLGGVCKNCRNNIFLKLKEKNKEQSCSVCGKTLLSETEICMACRNERVIKSCNKVVPILPYRLWAKNLMFSWKMMEKRGISSFIARLCHNAITDNFNLEQKVIVPVPPRPGKIREKGWDQIEELCSYLHNIYGYEILKLLRRNGKIQQKKLDREQRLKGSEERYAISKKGMSVKRENLPKRVILIDDVLTTGITVESCAKLLKSMGVEKVDVLTVFIVD